MRVVLVVNERKYCEQDLVSYWTYKKLASLSFQFFLIYKKLDSLISKNEFLISGDSLYARILKSKLVRMGGKL